MSIKIRIILYKVFLIILLLGQLYPIFFNRILIMDTIFHYTLSIYLIFRLFIFGILRDKALAMGITLEEFFENRDKFFD